ncbi:hypothetical protein BD779DRAFT_1516002 [Infundibulicybe gibba]|nr:hypothetical protein BD779DRAFT_1516002 [Infundibulicybe gibba]
MPAQRSRKASAQHSDFDAGSEEFEFPESQQSNGSDDYALEAALAKHYAEIREKRCKERETKFLQAAEKALLKDTSRPRDTIQSSMGQIIKLYDAFILRYAASEDRIRSLWVQIHQSQADLIELTQAKHTRTTALASKARVAHIAGLAKVKGACLDFQEVIDAIRDPSKPWH